jgi:tRNA-splicing ligase RtcB
MKCAINMSFANRQVILHRVREVFAEIFGSNIKNSMHMVYDVAHNTAQVEKHKVNGVDKELLVHRKGSTRAFGPGRRELPERFRTTGQPVIIGGSMETGSYLLAGINESAQSFCSTTHGSGRTMSRSKARKLWQGHNLQETLAQRGIYIRTASWPGLAEEAGGAYKDIDDIVRAAEIAGLSRKVARFTPIGNVKG